MIALISDTYIHIRVYFMVAFLNVCIYIYVCVLVFSMILTYILCIRMHVIYTYIYMIV